MKQRSSVAMSRVVRRTRWPPVSQPCVIGGCANTLEGAAAEHMRDGKGIFGMLKLPEEKMTLLATQEALYGLPDGRINIAALNDGNIKDVIQRIARVAKAA